MQSPDASEQFSRKPLGGFFLSPVVKSRNGKCPWIRLAGSAVFLDYVLRICGG